MDSKLSYSYIARGQGFKAVKWPESEGKNRRQGWFTLLQVGANFYKHNNLIASLFNVSIDLSFRVQCFSWKVPWSKLYHILWTSRGNGQWREGTLSLQGIHLPTVQLVFLICICQLTALNVCSLDNIPHLTVQTVSLIKTPQLTVLTVGESVPIALNVLQV